MAPRPLSLCRTRKKGNPEQEPGRVRHQKAIIVVAFSIIVQGLTTTTLLRYLGELATAHDPKNRP